MYTFQDLLDHFKDQPEVQSQILANTEIDVKGYIKRHSLAGLLYASFTFQHTPEGGDYWYKIADNLRFEAPTSPANIENEC